MARTDIPWAEHSWNPVTGCDPISAGCKNCYAKRMANRLKAMHQPKYANGFKVTCHESALQDPMKRKKPTIYFVDSMGDIFHKDVPFDFIDKIYASMALNPDDTFIILTKRYERMLEYASQFETDNNDRLFDAWYEYLGYLPDEKEMVLLIKLKWPLQNVWHGHSISNQDDADKSVQYLLKTESAKRIISLEPALDLVEFQKSWLTGYENVPTGTCLGAQSAGKTETFLVNSIDLIIMGGESGPDARPMHPDWARSVRDQCKDAGVPFYFKQWGEWIASAHVRCDGKSKGSFISNDYETLLAQNAISGDEAYLNDRMPFIMRRVGKQAAGYKLDGKIHREWP